MTEQTDKEPITADSFYDIILDLSYKYRFTVKEAEAINRSANSLVEKAITQHTTTLQAQLEKYKAAFALMSVNRFDADKENDALRAKLQEIRQSKGCLLAGPGRGDCEHFVGWPEKLDESTTDVYGIPNGWCIVCFHGKQLSDKDKEIERLKKEIDKYRGFIQFKHKLSLSESREQPEYWKQAKEAKTQLEQSEARLALVVEAHRNIIETCGVVNFSSHNQMREAVEGSLALAEEALTATTEQVSSYRSSLIQRAENAESALKTYINQNTEKATEISLLKQQVETLLVMVANMQEDGISGIELGDVVRCHLKEKILGQAWKKKDNHPNSKAFHSQGGL